MSMFTTTIVAAILGTGMSATPYAEQVESIALATASFQTCEQLGFSVDRQGISDWIESAKANAIAAGMDQSEVNSYLKAKIDFEWQRTLDRHAQALLMQHSPDHVWRNNRFWTSRCKRLAEDSLSSAYFSHPQP